MCFKNCILHKLICIVYLLKYLNTKVAVAFYMCRPSVLLFVDNNNRSRAVLTASRVPRKSSALGPIPTQPLIGIKL